MNSKLIEDLEQEMIQDVKSIEPPNETDINLEYVKAWYIEAEKCLRVVSNITEDPVSPAINQLRYAGHHILKAETTEDVDKVKPNLVEAYKHCKRSYYDILDFFVYRLHAISNNVIPFVHDNERDDISNQIHELLKKIMFARNNNEHRIDYYSQTVSESLIDGLKLISNINKKFGDTIISKKIFNQRKDLIRENMLLNFDNDQLNKKLNIKTTVLGVVFTAVLAISAILAPSVVSNMFFANKHEVIIKSEKPVIDKSGIGKLKYEKNTQQSVPSSQQTNN